MNQTNKTAESINFNSKKEEGGERVILHDAA